MADTEDAFDVGDSWIDLQTLTGIATGTEVTLQHVGSPNDLIDLAVSAVEPLVNFNGLKLEQYGFYRVAGGESAVWVRYKRLDRAVIGARVTKIQVQV